jgi:hypothetical protein
MEILILVALITDRTAEYCATYKELNQRHTLRSDTEVVIVAELSGIGPGICLPSIPALSHFAVLTAQR